MGEVGKIQNGSYSKVEENYNSTRLEENFDSNKPGEIYDSTRTGENDDRDSLKENGWNKEMEKSECASLTSEPVRPIHYNPVDTGWSWVILLCKSCFLCICFAYCLCVSFSVNVPFIYCLCAHLIHLMLCKTSVVSRVPPPRYCLSLIHI